MIKGIAHGLIHDARGFRRHQTTFVLALKLRLANEDGDHGRTAAHHIIAGDSRSALGLTDTVSVIGMTIDPFSGEVRDGRLWGRGATDTKGPMAAMLWALQEAAARLAAATSR